MIDKTKKLLTRKVFSKLLGTTPVSNIFGLDRGIPIDRYFIYDFLQNSSEYIIGDILEVAESTYTKKYGKNIQKSMILHYSDKKADIVGDLSTGKGIPNSISDCFIMTQTLPFIYDIKKVVKNSYKLLKPGGTLLVTVGGITQISRYDMDRWGHYWSFTDLSLRKALEVAFLPENIKIITYGNVKTASAFLYGISAEELSKKDLEYRDPDYQVIICASAKKN